MKLGFVSAILADQNLDEVLNFAASERFGCVELMCWPVGKAERRYAGVTHVELPDFTSTKADDVRAKLAGHGVAASALGYYPNFLSADRKEASACLEHFAKVIAAAPLLGVDTVTSFIGRDPAKSVDENWPLFLEVWKPLVKLAEDHGVRIAIENCPMFFTGDEWPGGKNLAISPAIWERMFNDIPSDHFGLNYDPSHLVWQQMDYLKPLRDFAAKLFHVHAKDVLIDREKLNQVGILATPLEYHQPKLPGLGEVDFGKFFAWLTQSGYDGPVCIEVEDRAYEGTLERRQAALKQSARFLRSFLSE